MIVEDHRRGHGGHQPSDLNVAPRMSVQPFVFGEGHHLVGRALAVPAQPRAPAREPSPLLRREFVGVQLVTEQDQHVRPLVFCTAGQPGGVTVERIEPELGLDLLHFGLGVPARPEDRPKPVRRPRPAGTDHARRERRVLERPDQLAVHPDLVFGGGVGGQIGHGDQGEMVPLHLECRRRAPENLNRARTFGLHPDQRGGVPDVSKGRTEQQGHQITLGQRFLRVRRSTPAPPPAPGRRVRAARAGPAPRVGIRRSRFRCPRRPASPSTAAAPPRA